MTALFDFASLLVVILLLICTFAYVRAWTLTRGPDGELSSWLEAGGKHKGGLRGCAWKAARVGERMSPYIAVCCVLMVRLTSFFSLRFVYPPPRAADSSPTRLLHLAGAARGVHKMKFGPPCEEVFQGTRLQHGLPLVLGPAGTRRRARAFFFIAGAPKSAHSFSALFRRGPLGRAPAPTPACHTAAIGNLQ